MASIFCHHQIFDIIKFLSHQNFDKITLFFVSDSSNYVVFNLPEMNDGNIIREKEQIENLLRDLGSDVGVSDCHLFRVGKLSDRNRPLVLKLNSQEDKSKIMFMAKGLKNKDKWKGVSITHDLTKLQCQKERMKEVELKKMAEEKNNHLSVIEKSQKIWKVVGGRGTRCLALRDVLLC